MPVLRRPLSARWGTWMGERQGGFLTGPLCGSRAAGSRKGWNRGAWGGRLGGGGRWIAGSPEGVQ